MESDPPQWKVLLRAESGERFELSAGETFVGRCFPTKWDEALIPRNQLVFNVDAKLRRVTVKRVSDVPSTLRRLRHYESYIELGKDKLVDVQHQDILCLAFKKYLIGVEIGWNLPQTNARPVWISRPRPKSPPRVKVPPPPKRKTTPPDSPKYDFEKSFEPDEDPVSEAKPDPPKAAAPAKVAPSTIKREGSLLLTNSDDDDDDILRFDIHNPPAIVPRSSVPDSSSSATAAAVTTSDDNRVGLEKSLELISSGRNTASLAKQEGVKSAAKKDTEPTKTPATGPKVTHSAAAQKAKAAAAAKKAASTSSRGTKKNSSAAHSTSNDEDTDDAFSQFYDSKTKTNANTKKKSTDDDGFVPAKLDSDDDMVLAHGQKLVKRAGHGNPAPPKRKVQVDEEIYDHSDSDSRSAHLRSKKASATPSLPKPIPPTRMEKPQKKEIPPPSHDGKTDEEYAAGLDAYYRAVDKNDEEYDAAMAVYLDQLEKQENKARTSSASSKHASTASSSSSNTKKRKADSSTSTEDDRKKKSKTGDPEQDAFLHEEFRYKASEASSRKRNGKPSNGEAIDLTD